MRGTNLVYYSNTQMLLLGVDELRRQSYRGLATGPDVDPRDFSSVKYGHHASRLDHSAGVRWWYFAEQKGMELFLQEINQETRDE